jgi:NAD(P)-dependent dehydrogenase (short-subunit alcohol dehydrogenase family)
MTARSERLSGRTALVMGAGSSAPGWSIGKATAVALSRAGANVVAVDIDAAAAADVCEIIRGEGGACEAVVGDVTREDDVSRAVGAALNRFGRIDILQNNVGVVHLGGPVEMSVETWTASMWLNVGAAFLATKHVVPTMQAQGSGVITNISSIAGERWVGVAMVGYSAFKAALISFSRSVALQYAPTGIRSNAIVVGRMDTPLLRKSFGALYRDDDALVADKSAICPTGRLGQPWDIADASVFLASDEAKYITGAMLPVDGGVLCQS